LITLELFCGTKSFSKVAKELGHETFTVDIDSKLEPDLVCDILDFKLEMLPEKFRKPDVVWASPPCTTFSVASIGKHWNKDRTPKSKEAEIGIKIINKTINLLLEIEPTYWFIENPRGMLRKMIPEYIFYRRTVSYCQYGDSRMKPTDIWTNLNNWEGKMCRPKSSCHVSAPRGSRTGTQGLKDASARGVIPSALFYEIFKAVENN
jgi:site-specific DNA-cytosine methylase